VQSTYDGSTIDKVIIRPFSLFLSLDSEEATSIDFNFEARRTSMIPLTTHLSMIVH